MSAWAIAAIVIGALLLAGCWAAYAAEVGEKGGTGGSP